MTIQHIHSFIQTTTPTKYFWQCFESIRIRIFGWVSDSFQDFMATYFTREKCCQRIIIVIKFRQKKNKNWSFFSLIEYNFVYFIYVCVRNILFKRVCVIKFMYWMRLNFKQDIQNELRIKSKMYWDKETWTKYTDDDFVASILD